MITAEQRLARATRIGSSDAPAVLGLDHFRSAADVFLEKTGRAEGFDGNAATDRGNWLEPALIAFAREKLREVSKVFRPDQMFIDESGLLCANMDAITPDLTQGIEAKSTVIEEGWGDEGTDQVPERVNAQVAHQFAVIPTLAVIWVPVVIPAFKRFDFRLYRVERNPELVEIVGEEGRRFMREHVLAAIPPDDFRPSLEVLKRVRREPNKVVELSEEIVVAFKAAKARKKEADDDCKAREAEILTALGDAERGTSPAGSITYMEQKRKGYVVEPTTFRVLRVGK